MLRCVAAVLVLVTASSLSAQVRGLWEQRASLPVARQEVGAAELDGKLYVAGGMVQGRTATARVACYDPATKTWTQVQNMPTPRHHFGMCSAGGKLYVIGGYIGDFCGSNCPPDERCYSYDPGTNTWSPIADLPRARGAFVAVEIGGKIYAAGGVIGEGFIVGDLTVYDPATDQWETKATMPTAREHLGAANLNGKLYVAGGRIGGHGTVFATLESYDPATDQWSTHTPMPTARGGNGAAVLDGKLIVMGGEFDELDHLLEETEEYDPQTDSWRTLTPMPVPVHGFYPVTVGDEIIAAGGGPAEGFAVTDVVYAFRRSSSCTPRDGVRSVGFGTLASRGHALGFDVCAGNEGTAGGEAVLTGAAPNSEALLLVSPTLTGAIDSPWSEMIGNATVAAVVVADHQGSARWRLPAITGPARLVAQWAVANRDARSGFAFSEALQIEWR